MPYETARPSNTPPNQLPLPDYVDVFGWPFIESLPDMPKPKQAEKRGALVLIEQCPAEKIKLWVLENIRASNAVMIGATRSGKALVITRFTEDGREKEYPEELEELYDVLDVSTEKPF